MKATRLFQSLVVFVFCTSLFSTVWAESLQDMIEKSEKSKTASSQQGVSQEGAAVDETAGFTGTGDKIGHQIRYQVDPKSIAAASKDSLAAIGRSISTGDFVCDAMGFFIGPGGYLLTTSRALKAEGAPSVVTVDGNLFESEVILTDEESGVVLLKVPVDFPYFPLSDPKELVIKGAMFAISPSRPARDWVNAAPDMQSIPCGLALEETSEGTSDETLVLSERFSTEVELAGNQSGTPILDSFGDVAGIYIGKIDSLDDERERMSRKNSLASRNIDGASETAEAGAIESATESVKETPEELPAETAESDVQRDAKGLVISIEVGKRMLEQAML